MNVSVKSNFHDLPKDMPLIIPTPELIRKYGKEFDKDPAVKAITKLIKLMPRNDNMDDVLVKTAVINDLYSANIYVARDVAKGIIAIAIQGLDRRISEGDVSVVEDVAIAGGGNRNYSFATKYCSWHKPYKYPIFDSKVESLLTQYGLERINPFSMDEPFTIPPGTNLRDYYTFRGIVDNFRKICRLEEIGYQALDKFLYLYAKERGL